MAELPLRRRVAIAREHPAFAGHFPGQPLLPGVVLLGEALEVLLRDAPEVLGNAPRVSAVKFLAPVRPGAHLEVQWLAPAQGRARFEVWRHAPEDPAAGVLAASGQLEVAGSNA
jgi:3-hydroxyacyl-[acyl-carrier-protein] dehydratase